MKEIILFVEFGGLGDHLFFSPLPRLLKSYGLADKVFLSNKSPFRNSQTYDLVWKDNPFFDGISFEEPSHSLPSDSKIDKVINHIASSYGLTDVEFELLPEVYGFNPTGNSSYRGGKYLDLNYISFVGGFSIIDKFKLLWKYKNHIVVNPSWDILPFVSKRCVYTSGLLDYASLIVDSDNFVCLASGGATLAAALNKNATVYYGYGQPTIFHHKTNLNIMVGGGGFYRRQLCRMLFKYNQLRKFYNKSK